MKTRGALRLAILGTRGIPAAYGGFETFAEELSARLVGAGIDVTVYCEAGPRNEPQSYRGVHLRYIPAPPRGALTTLLFDLRCLWDARKSFNAVYMLGYGAAPACLIPRLYGSRVWLNVDGIEWKRAKWGRLARAYFRSMEWFSARVPDLIIADAEGVHQHLQSRHGRIKPCRVIPYGAPVISVAPPSALLSPWNLSPGSYYLVVSRLEPANHVREIVEGYLASSTAAPLVVVGDHETSSDYVQALRKFQSDRVLFIGTVFDSISLQALRYHARAYFHGHSVGGTNPSLLEAMGCGNLVIGHDNPFNREVLGEYGWFFDEPADILACVAEIEEISDSELATLKEGIRSRVAARYAWEDIASAYLELLSQRHLQAG